MRTVKDTVPLIASLGQDCRQPVRIEDHGFPPTRKVYPPFYDFPSLSTFLEEGRHSKILTLFIPTQVWKFIIVSFPVS